MFLYSGGLNGRSSVLDGEKSKLNELREGMNPKNNHSFQSLNKWVLKKGNHLLTRNGKSCAVSYNILLLTD